MKILVPTDFSNAASIAVSYATELAGQIKAEITLLHVLPKIPGVDAGFVRNSIVYAEVANRLQKQSEELSAESGVKTSFTVKVGNIFDSIGEAAVETESFLIILATHGKKGIQHFVGSFAGKVIQAATVPVLVVQKQLEVSKVSAISVYLDFDRKVQNLVESAIHYGKQLNCPVELILPQNIASFPSQKIDMSLGEVEEAFVSAGVIYNKNFLSGSGLHVIQEAINLSVDKGCGFLIINYGKNDWDPDFGKASQNAIVNKHRLPVMCLPKF